MLAPGEPGTGLWDSAIFEQTTVAHGTVVRVVVVGRERRMRCRLAEGKRECLEAGRGDTVHYSNPVLQRNGSSPGGASVEKKLGAVLVLYNGNDYI